MALRSARIVAVAAAMALFVVLRSAGNDFGDPPVMQHADERHYAGVASILTGDDPSPRVFENPPLLTYALFAAKELHRACMGDEASRDWVAGGGLFRLARWFSAVLGALTALVTGAAARCLLGSFRAGAAAAVVVGTSFLHGRDSHYGVNDVPMVFLVAVSFWLAARWRRDPQLHLFVLATAAAGLAAATKYNGAIAAVLPVAALWTRRKQPTTRSFAARVTTSGLLLLLAASVFLLANPYSWLTFGEFRAGFLRQLLTYGDEPWWGQSRGSTLLLYGGATLALLGVAHAAAALAGVLAMFRFDGSDRSVVRAALFVAALPAAYLAGMLTKELFFFRFALPLLPFFAVFAAAGWCALARAIASRVSRLREPAVLAALVALGSVEPVARLARHDQLLMRPHTWMQARAWILEHVPAGDQLFVEGLPPRLPEHFHVVHAGIDLDKVGTVPKRRAEDPHASAIDNGGWLITDSICEQGFAMNPHAPRSLRMLAFYERLRGAFEPVATFAPGPDGDPHPFVLDSIYSPLVDLWGVDRPGTTIRIYRLDAEDWSRKLAGP